MDTIFWVVEVVGLFVLGAITASIVIRGMDAKDEYEGEYEDTEEN